MIPPRYIILANGTVIGPSGATMKPSIWGKGGYATLKFQLGGSKEKTLHVHEVVCEAFHGPKPDWAECVRHLDGDPLNNAASNLAWGTYSENMADRKLHGTDHAGERAPMVKLTEQQVLDIRARYAAGGVSYAALGREYGVHRATIGLLVRRINWQHI